MPPLKRSDVRVVVADDDVVTREILARTLRACDLEVYVAADGESAWTQMQDQRRPVLAILDWMMPGVEGPDLCRRVRADLANANVYLILLTARDGSGDVVVGLEAGADDYLTKPCKPAELHARVAVGLRMLALQARLNERVDGLELALDRVKRSERQYRTLFEESRDAICVSAEDGSIADVNPALMSMFGYRKEELVGNQVSTLLANPADSSLFTVAQTSTESYESEVKCRRKDGTLRECVVIRTVRYDEAGTIIGLQLIIRDVTESLALEAQLRQAHKMEAVGRLAGGIAHDFNNLLTSIFGYTELALDHLPSSHAARASAEEVAKAAQCAARLTHQLLAFSRRQVLKPAVLDLNRVVTDLTGILARTLGDTIALDVRLSETPIVVKADLSQLQQVILNLAINARDAMPSGGGLTIQTNRISVRGHSLMPAGEYVRLEVTDTGAGIPDDVMANIFEPFFSTKGDAGTGLGLSTVYGIVKQSGGFIWVDSQIGRGTTFRVELPFCDEAVVLSEDQQPIPGTGPSASTTILLVEDNRVVRELLTKQFRSRGYGVLTAANGAEALAVAANHAGVIDVLVTDVMMPGVSGPELADQLLGIRPNMRVLLISGYSRVSIGSRYPLLAKPFTHRELLARTQQLLAADPVHQEK